MEWIFSGVGTEILKFIFTLLLGLSGGIPIGYKIAIRKNKMIQKQKAKDNATQTQIGKVNYSQGDKSDSATLGIANNNLQQVQVAGDNSIQNQTGSIGNE